MLLNQDQFYDDSIHSVSISRFCGVGMIGWNIRLSQRQRPFGRYFPRATLLKFKECALKWRTWSRIPQKRTSVVNSPSVFSPLLDPRLKSYSLFLHCLTTHSPPRSRIGPIEKEIHKPLLDWRVNYARDPTVNVNLCLPYLLFRGNKIPLRGANLIFVVERVYNPYILA